LLHGHSFEGICTKFGLWHPYTLQIVLVGLLASGIRAPLQIAADREYLTSGAQNLLHWEILN